MMGKLVKGFSMTTLFCCTSTVKSWRCPSFLTRRKVYFISPKLECRSLYFPSSYFWYWMPDFFLWFSNLCWWDVTLVCNLYQTGMEMPLILLSDQENNMYFFWRTLVVAAIIVVSGVEFSSSSKLQNYVHHTVHNSPLKPATLHHHTETYVYLGTATSLKPKLFLFYTTIAQGWKRWPYPSWGSTIDTDVIDWVHARSYCLKHITSWPIAINLLERELSYLVWVSPRNAEM